MSAPLLTLPEAAEYAAEIKSGVRRYEDVPAAITPYLDAGFPRPKIIGKGIRRIRTAELEAWLQ